MSRKQKPFWAPLFGVLSILLFCQVAHGQHWAARLGYPAGQRVVLIDAREMGLSWEMNQAGTELYESGKVQAITGLATGPWFGDFAEWCRAHRIQEAGISIALTNPYDRISWRLASSRDEVPSLVDHDGFPWETVFQFAVNATAEDVEKEIHAQIQRARAAGLELSHMSSYHGTIYSRADTAAALLKAARKYWIPVPVVELTPAHIKQFREQGYPLDDNLIELVRTYPLPKLDHLEIIPDGASYEEKRDQFCEMLTNLKPGLTMLMLRPATASAGVERLGPGWQQRIWDAQLLSDDKVQAAMKEQNIATTNWSEIMRRFEGEQQPIDLDVSETTQDADDVPAEESIFDEN